MRPPCLSRRLRGKPLRLQARRHKNRSRYRRLVGRLSCGVLWVSCVLARFTGILPGFHQNFTRIHWNITICSPNFRLNIKFERFKQGDKQLGLPTRQHTFAFKIQAAWKTIVAEQEGVRQSRMSRVKHPMLRLIQNIMLRLNQHAGTGRV